MQIDPLSYGWFECPWRQMRSDRNLPMARRVHGWTCSWPCHRACSTHLVKSGVDDYCVMALARVSYQPSRGAPEQSKTRRNSANVVVPASRPSHPALFDLVISDQFEVKVSPNRRFLGIGFGFAGRFSFNDKRLCLMTHRSSRHDSQTNFSGCIACCNRSL